VRITNQIIQRRALESIQRGMRSLDEAYNEISTGQRVRRASDDPANYAGAVAADRRIEALLQYRRNIESSLARMSSEETALDQLTNLLDRARELGVSQAASNGTTATRLIVKAEVDQLIEETIALGNTRHGNAFLFGGDFADQRPFDAAGAINPNQPPGGGITAEIADGRVVRVNHDGVEVFVDSGVLQALRDLSTALGADDTPGVANALTGLTAAFDEVQHLLGETGARVRQLDNALANIDALEATVRTQRSDLTDVELEEAISKLASRQNAYEAALLATSRINTLTLTDYLR
jgi:flagellar hook-associated protein 3 FlgL